MRVSVVAEWENVRLAEAGRARAMLEELVRQAGRLRANGEGPADDGSAPALLSEPLELIVLYDEGMLDGARVADFVGAAVGPNARDIRLRLVPVSGGTYYELKNAGARLAEGDVVVLLDSDVIPEEGWLASLLDSLADPSVQVVGGNSYIDPTSLWAKAFALAWFFPLRAENGAVHPYPGFFANNVAFRRETLLRFPFPTVEGATRGACRMLAEELGRAGISVYRNPAARVSHPAPNGLRHGVVRALAGGRDRLVVARDADAGSVRASFARYGHDVKRAASKIVVHRQKVGVSLAGLPVVLAVAVGYYTLVLLGELLTHARPKAMEKRFRI